MAYLGEIGFSVGDQWEYEASRYRQSNEAFQYISDLGNYQVHVRVEG